MSNHSLPAQGSDLSFSHKIVVQLHMSKKLFAAKHLAIPQSDSFAHEQTIVCKQLFEGHVVCSWLMKRKKNALNDKNI